MYTRCQLQLEQFLFKFQFLIVLSRGVFELIEALQLISKYDGLALFRQPIVLNVLEVIRLVDDGLDDLVHDKFQQVGITQVTAKTTSGGGRIENVVAHLATVLVSFPKRRSKIVRVEPRGWRPFELSDTVL